MSPVVIALLICLVAAALEGALAGGCVRERFAQLRLPPYSPPLALWIVIGLLYYILCFVLLQHLLTTAPFTRLHSGAFALLIVVLLANSFWNILFFRLRTLRGSFFAFIPYGIMVAALTGLFASIYPFGAGLLACYCIYIVYATWWGYRLWRLNDPNA